MVEDLTLEVEDAFFDEVDANLTVVVDSFCVAVEVLLIGEPTV